MQPDRCAPDLRRDELHVDPQCAFDLASTTFHRLAHAEFLADTFDICRLALASKRRIADAHERGRQVLGEAIHCIVVTSPTTEVIEWQYDHGQFSGTLDNPTSMLPLPRGLLSFGLAERIESGDLLALALEVSSQTLVKTCRTFVETASGRVLADELSDLFHLRDPAIGLRIHARYLAGEPTEQRGLTG